MLSSCPTDHCFSHEVTSPSVPHILTGLLLQNSSSHGNTAKAPKDIHHSVSIVYSFADLLPYKILRFNLNVIYWMGDRNHVEYYRCNVFY